MAIVVKNYGTDFRPKSFRELVNPSQSIINIAGLLQRGESPLTYLLSGPYGCGKTTMAEILARYLLCKTPVAGTNEPCGTCSACTTPLTANSDYQYHNSSNVGVNESRDIVESVKFRPRMSARRVVVFDEAHKLTHQASSNILVPVETPPNDYVVWIMATDQPSGLRPQLISRAVHGVVELPRLEDVMLLLSRTSVATGIEVAPDVLKAIAVASGCHYRDALNLLHLGLASGGLRSEDVDSLVAHAPAVLAKTILSSILRGNPVDALRAAAMTSEHRTVIRLLADFTSRLVTHTIASVGLQSWEIADFASIVQDVPRQAWTSTALTMLPDTEVICRDLQQFAVPEATALNNFIVRWSLRAQEALRATGGN